MINYKKGLLSLAAVLAIVSQAGASNYLSLATDTNDYRWAMFGVDGFAGNSQTADFGTGAAWTILTETVGDEVATAGFDDPNTAGTNNMAELKALINTTDDLTGLIANMDLTNVLYSETEAFRSMFVKLPSTAGEPNVLFTYKASLEGQALEFQINGVTTITYTTTISALNTYDNPSVPIIKTIGGDSNTSLTTLIDVVDYDFSNNPQDSGSYLKATHQDTATGVTRMYSYDSINSSWLIYDSGNAAAANDFSSLTKGKAYWGRMDVDANDKTLNDKNVTAGLVLGSGGITDSTYADNNLSAGWNLMSFSSLKPDIITATTGIIVTDDTSSSADSNDTITIYDYTGINNFQVVLLDTGSESYHAQQINMALESAKARGDMPDTFDLRVFSSGNNVAGASTHLVFISNKRFYIKDDSAAAFTTGTSLDTTDATSRLLWDVATNDYVDYNALTLPNTLVGSVYGDFAIAFTPLVGIDTAAELDNTVAVNASGQRSAAIQVNEDSLNLVYLASNDGGSSIIDTADNFATVLKKQDDVAGNANSASGSTITVDIDNSGTDDFIIAVSDTEFYIRDHTFIRVFNYLNDAAATFYLEGTDSETNAPGEAVTAANPYAIADVETAVNALAENGLTTETGVFADIDGTKLILVSALANKNTYNMHDSVVDHLTDTTSTLGTAKGAVSNVFLVNTLAGRAIYSHESSLTFANAAAFNDLNSSTVKLIVNKGALEADITAITTTDTDAEKDSALSAIVADIKRAAVVAGYDVNTYHDFNVTSPSYPTTITIESYSIANLDIDTDDNVTNGGEHNSTDANSAMYGELITQTGDYTTNLKYNAVSSPNYSQSGPTYVMKDNNYTIQALITGSTNMAAGTISWSSIDLTRTASDMFASQDFNLFSIDPKAGYWAYLVMNSDSASPTNDITIAAVDGTLVPTFTHHFDDGAVTARNNIRASLTVTIGGLTVPATGVASTERVWANVGGNTVELVGTPSIGEYTANIDTYDITLASGDVTVSVSDGEGWLLASQSVGSIDIVKPITPTIDLAGGFSVDSNSTDVVAYYIFKTAIEETVMHSADPSTGSNYVGYLLDGAAAIDFCSSAALTFNSSISLLTVAVDGSGTFTKGNISDVASTTYYAIEKGSNFYTHLGLGDAADELGLPHATDCTTGTEETVDRGVSIKSVTTGVVTKLAIKPIDGAEFALDIPNTVYVTDGTNIAEIKFTSAYLAAPFYIQFDGVLYDGRLPTDISTTAGDRVIDFDTTGFAIDVSKAGDTPNTGATSSIPAQSF